MLALHRQTFQSPSGDSLFSDPIQIDRVYKEEIYCFNPLAGIRCFLTRRVVCLIDVSLRGFQSPCGDSLFSDEGISTHWVVLCRMVSIP